MFDPSTTPLSPMETRVLGVLIEKQSITPDTYPLTPNALTAGCNQKSSRHPVIDASEQEVQAAIDGLKQRTLVTESYGASGRVLRYAHNLPKVLNLGQTATVLLAVLMLRGPQTPGELRTNCERLYRFPDISALEAYLEELAGRSSGALVAKLPRQPGSREHRWAQLLSGPAETDVPVRAPQRATDDGGLAALREELARLREEVAELRAMVEALRRTPDAGA